MVVNDFGQKDRFQSALGTILEKNEFYKKKFGASGIDSAQQIKFWEDYCQLPLSTKDELVADQISYPPYGTNLTFSESHYTRIHQTSGTTGQPLRWLDDTDSWNWWGKCWKDVYEAAGVSAKDRIFFAFSFGPFIGFWSAFEGARQLGALGIPGGGMTSLQRLRAIIANRITVLVCTPTYALHLAEIAHSENINIVDSDVQVTIHAGEPGASLPATSQRIAEAWGAVCYDHTGATEVGAWGFMCEAQDGVHLNQEQFIFEIIDPETMENDKKEGELVITNLGRVGSPVIRYRTGDYVRLNPSPCSCGRISPRIDGGIIGRIDDLMIVRGVNLYPSAIENLVRSFSDIDEFSVFVHQKQLLDEIEVQIEGSDPTAKQLQSAFRERFGLRAKVITVATGSLPRYELKSRRFTDHRRMNNTNN